jgi:hypothetical protein
MSISTYPKRYIKNFMPQFYNHEKKEFLEHCISINDVKAIKKSESSENSGEIRLNSVNEL